MLLFFFKRPLYVCGACAQALEELVNCDFTPEVQKLYGSTLCLRLNLARVQLVLALSNSVHGAPVPGLFARLLSSLCDLFWFCVWIM